MTDIVLFDLDHTLLDGDSDYEWGIFMCDTHLVDAVAFRQRNQFFYEQYTAGELDIFAYLKFALEPLSVHSNETLFSSREDFIKQRIKPLIKPSAQELVTQHKKSGNTTIIITATNRFITEPIAEIFGVDGLIATDIETQHGAFTGNLEGIPCFQKGKVKRFIQWLDENKPNYRETWFYSDSINDLALLEYVDHPVIKNGDEKITQIAKQRGWSIIP